MGSRERHDGVHGSPARVTRRRRCYLPQGSNIDSFLVECTVAQVLATTRFETGLVVW